MLGWGAELKENNMKGDYLLQIIKNIHLVPVHSFETPSAS